MAIFYLRELYAFKNQVELDMSVFNASLCLLANHVSDVYWALSKVVVKLQPHLRHTDKKCDCLSFVRENFEWVYDLELRLQKKIKLSEKNMTNECYCKEFMRKYENFADECFELQM